MHKKTRQVLQNFLILGGLLVGIPMILYHVFSWDFTWYGTAKNAFSSETLIKKKRKCEERMSTGKDEGIQDFLFPFYAESPLNIVECNFFHLGIILVNVGMEFHRISNGVVHWWPLFFLGNEQKSNGSKELFIF